jgi:acyl-CoA dehydrogenase
MSDELDLLAETLRSIFARHFGRDDRSQLDGAMPQDVWRALEEAGLTRLGLPDSGAGLPELTTVAREVGRAAVPVPLMEMSGLATWLLAVTGLPAPDGILTCAAAHPSDCLRLTRVGDGWLVDGTVHRVPWGASADHVVALARVDDASMAVLLPPSSAVKSGRNHAGERRDTLSYDKVLIPVEHVASSDVDLETFAMRGALLRSAAMVGAMESARDMTLRYAEERRQFGKPISSFQAVQAHLVAIVEETACADMAVRAAAIVEERQQPLAFAAAKVTAGKAAEEVAARAHQVHGAIGTTDEHALPWYTTRLWSWQDEFGSADRWAGRIGAQVVAAGAEQLWPIISASLRLAPMVESA